MQYQCRVSDSQGRISRGLYQAENPRELASDLQEQKLYLISYKEHSTPARSSSRKQQKAVLEFTQGLSLMIQSGLSLKDSFEVARGLYDKGNTGALVEDLAERIRKGDSFSRAIQRKERVFPSLYRGMVRVGERVGQLDRVLPSLAAWMKEDKELKGTITGALLYPALVLTMVFLGILALLLLFVPRMEEMMSYSGDQESLNNAIASAQSLLFIFMAIPFLTLFSILLWKRLRRSSIKLAEKLDRFKLGLPIIGAFILNRELLSLSFALTVLTECRVPLEEGLSEGSEVLNNLYLKAELLNIQKQLIKGENLSSLLQRSHGYPDEFSRWVAVGEKTAQIDRVFSQLKEYYSQEMKKKLNRISNLAGPAVIILLGIVLLGIILKVILPMLTLYGGLG